MVTYWIRATAPPLNRATSVSSFASHDSKLLEIDIKEETVSVTRKATENTDRLVDWCTDILEKYLRQIVAFRGASTRLGRKRRSSDDVAPMARSKMVIDEVTPVVQLPDYDPKLTRAMKDDVPDVDFSETVVYQLRRFVTEICSMYRDNPFHNFEVSNCASIHQSQILTRFF